MWNTFLYGQRRYNQNRPVALAASAAVSIALSARIGNVLAGSSALSVVTADGVITKAVPLSGTSLIKFTQASALVGAGGALLESDVFCTFLALGQLDIALRISAQVSFVTEGYISRVVPLASDKAITVTGAGSLVAGKALQSTATAVNVNVVAPIKVDIVTRADPALISLVTEGRLANTLNVSGVAISAATTAASLDVVKTLAASINLSVNNVAGSLGTNLNGVASAINFNTFGALRSAGLHDFGGHSVVLMTSDGALDQRVPLSVVPATVEVGTAADLDRYNNKTLAGVVPLTLVASNAALAKDVSLAANAVVQLNSAGTIRNLETLAGSASITFAANAGLLGAVGLNPQPINVRLTSTGSIHLYPISLLLANVGVSEVVVRDIAVEIEIHDISVVIDDGAMAVDAEVFLIDAREAA